MPENKNDYHFLRLMQKDDFFKVAFKPENIADIYKYEDAMNINRRVILEPIRFSNPEDEKEVNKYINDAPKNLVHYICHLHTLQEDPNQGLTICNNMNYAIFFAHTVKMFLTESTRGIWFDTGIGHFYGRPFELINKPDWKDDFTVYIDKLYNTNKETVFKSKEQTLKDKENVLHNEMEDFRKYVKDRDALTLKLNFEDAKTIYDEVYKTITKEDLIKFGMIFAATKHYENKTFTLENIGEAKENSLIEDNLKDPIKKSYTKVALKLVDLCKYPRKI
ncbi:TPA: hypothetical protein HA235_06400 [Candidatus Woesearchaeota archaeon]|nr:hypothetical protein [Candidatus Woesearchaeota archaeon]HIH32309.1 hypothetical protein [Candidatus Woesearchaeota archaeon]HIH55073.1 hypothetical protein [Candidatus Woesearchaeota archaeon]HIJ13825.1 hypothetical protein [Candidatus Woesearchaeota archaeon]